MINSEDILLFLEAAYVDCPPEIMAALEFCSSTGDVDLGDVRIDDCEHVKEVNILVKKYLKAFCEMCGDKECSLCPVFKARRIRW